MDSIVILKQSATKNTALTSAPRTSARAQPNVFLLHFFGDIWKSDETGNYGAIRKVMQLNLTFTERNEMSSAAMSPSMWKLSATSDIEFVTYPVIISTKKKLIVSDITDKSRHFFPLNLPIALDDFGGSGWSAEKWKANKFRLSFFFLLIKACSRFSPFRAFLHQPKSTHHTVNV